jgi:hypothetical protein
MLNLSENFVQAVDRYTSRIGLIDAVVSAVASKLPGGTAKACHGFAWLCATACCDNGCSTSQGALCHYYAASRDNCIAGIWNSCFVKCDSSCPA